MRIPITLAIGLTLTATAVGVSLARTPLVRVGTDGTPLPTEIGATAVPTTICQPEEVLPQGTTAIRISLLSLLGPRIKVQAKAGGRVVTSGETGYGWTGAVVQIPVKRVARTTAHATVCFTLAQRQQLVNLRGQNTPKAPAVTEGNQVLPGRMRMEYLRAGDRSWWSLIGSTAQRLGFNIGGSAWIALLPLTLLLSVVGLSSWLLTRELR